MTMSNKYQLDRHNQANNLTRLPNSEAKPHNMNLFFLFLTTDDQVSLLLPTGRRAQGTRDLLPRPKADYAALPRRSISFKSSSGIVHHPGAVEPSCTRPLPPNLICDVRAVSGSKVSVNPATYQRFKRNFASSCDMGDLPSDNCFLQMVPGVS